MQIEYTYKHRSTGKMARGIYQDTDSVAEMCSKKVDGAKGYCFYNGKLAIVYSESKGYWSTPGGGIEDGETVEEGLAREILEESNMRIVSHILMGYRDTVYEDGPTLRHTYFFCIVEPVGDFVCDPGGEITEMKLINPEEFPKYIDWGGVGDYSIKKAISLYNSKK